MGDAADDRAKAAQFPEGDVIRILLEQHATVRELFGAVTNAQGKRKKELFDQLRALLAVHETGEEMILRPVSKEAAGESVAEARNREEKEANKVLKKLEGMDVDSADFARELRDFEAAVSDHAEKEETEEFPKILATCDESKRASLGKRLKLVEAMAPTHPHPSAAGSTAAQYLTGPFASMVDRVRDALTVNR
jgi:hemerythrin superfamily protein